MACGPGKDSPLQGAIIGRVDDPLISGDIQNSLSLQGGHIAAMMQLCHCEAACTPAYPLSTSLLPEQHPAAAFTQARQRGQKSWPRAEGLALAWEPELVYVLKVLLPVLFCSQIQDASTP